jgi:hypothetical protein
MMVRVERQALTVHPHRRENQHGKRLIKIAILPISAQVLYTGARLFLTPE